MTTGGSAMRILAILILAALAPAVRAEQSRFEWGGVLTYDPTRVIARNGGTLGALMAEFWGPDANGAVRLSGAVVFEANPAPTTANGVIAGYRNVVVSETLQFGSMSLAFDPVLVEANVASSKVGMVAMSDGGFCVDHEHCSSGGIAYPPWGNLGAVLNDSGHLLLDETGPNPKTGDVLGFMVGRTAAMGEFAPTVQTSGFGIIGIDGLALILFSSAGGQLVPSIALPHMRALIGNTQIGRTEVWLFVEGPDLLETVRIEGVIDDLRIDP